MGPRKYGEIPLENLNKILASLPTSSRYWLESLEPVVLPKGTVLYEPDENIEHVYFLNNALVSLVSTNSDGSTVEIGLIGHEGMVGVPAILGGVTPYRAIVQMDGDAFRIHAQRLYVEFRRNPFLRDLLLKYTNAFIIQIAQSSICNCYHTLQERLCRWLLVARDAVCSDVLLLTHDVIARLLGTRRASVTVAAGLLQRAGLIRISRGQLTILDAAGLEAMACECYSILRDGIRRLQAS
ncbi:MAG: Crp/Fnr family transcriptional regulator [Acidobacteria bacterium]|nr:MAG: Crp/Fnr family transcriptional regulator [Acidobacteriota bacterium]